MKEKFELSRGGGAHNVRPMEGLRGFAVLLVFLVHYAGLATPWVDGSPGILAVTESVHTLGSVGVDLFFVLSGYLIYGSLISRYRPFLPFLARRIERIYPAFTAVFVLYIALSFAFPHENKIPEPVTEGAIYLLQNYLLLPGLLPIQAMITVSWSLSYEMFYYLAMPVLIGALNLRDRSPKWRTLLFLALGIAGAVVSAFYDGPTRLLMFIAGIVLYEVLKNSQLRASSSAGVIALVIGFSCMLLPIPGPAAHVIKVVILAAAFFTLCLACFGTPGAWLPSAFSWTPLRWLGNMSYSYYLLHGLALKGVFLALAKVLPPTGMQPEVLWLMLLPALAITLIASAPLFLLIERPFSLAPDAKPSSAAKPVRPQAASASESGS